MDQQQLKLLLSKYQSGEATPAEVQLLNSWYMAQASRNSDLTLKEVEDAEQDMADDIYKHIQKTRDIQIKPKTYMFGTWSAVAALVCMMIFGLFLFRDDVFNKTERYEDHIRPGRNAATLILANGKKIILSDSQMGELAKESGLTIRKSSDGLIEYQVSDEGYNDVAGVNILSTAKGESYRLRLTDGTVVWLNAASSLRFPTSFSNSKYRNVELSGEAYFEVSKDKDHPFIVTTEGQEVKVLGTQFNLSNYNDEPSVYTTLVEGSVSVRPLSLTENQSTVLSPGQRSALSGNRLRIAEVDTEEAVAWKNGDFTFKNENIGSIMRKLARWYDIDIKYEGDLSDLVFTGVVSRSKNISSVLRIMESTGNVHFKIEGRRITVKR